MYVCMSINQSINQSTLYKHCMLDVRYYIYHIMYNVHPLQFLTHTLYACMYICRDANMYQKSNTPFSYIICLLCKKPIGKESFGLRHRSYFFSFFFSFLSSLVCITLSLVPCTTCTTCVCSSLHTHTHMKNLRYHFPTCYMPIL